ncbi:MAG: aldo/keto reductase [Bacillota bacterium]
MEYAMLGGTGIRVSRLCFGTLTLSPLQAKLPPEEARRVLLHAMRRGVNFFDCAELYGTYRVVGEAMRAWGEPVVVVGRSYAWTRKGMEASLHRALREFSRDYVDIFLLHEMESPANIRGHWEALEYLAEAKQQGLVRAVGISTHHVGAVETASAIDLIDVIHPLYNPPGIGIRGGSSDDMLAAIRRAARAGKGIYGMKALAGGHLVRDAENALRAVLAIPELAAVAVGMQSMVEVEYNTRIFSGQEVPEGLKVIVRRAGRRLHVEEWCRGCGECVKVCRFEALRIERGRALADRTKCCFCGYCAAACPEFCIKVV